MKTVKIGDTHRIIYVAKNFTTGLTNVTGVAYGPDGTRRPSTGGYAFTELGTGTGIYYYDFATTGLAAGEWTFKVNSATQHAMASSSVQLVDGATLDNTPFEGIDTNIDTINSNLTVVDGVVDGIDGKIGTPAGASLSADVAAIKTVVDTINGNTDTVESSLTTIDANVTSIDGKIGTPTGSSVSSDIAAMQADIDALSTAVSGISNSTKNTWVTSEEVIIPASGSISRRIFMNVFDSAGNMEDPDSSQIRVQVYTMAGTDVTTQFVAGVEPIYMTRDAVGQYRIDFVVESTDAEQPLVFKHTYSESALTVVRQGVVELVAAVNADIGTRLDSIDAALTTIEGYTDTVETVLGTPEGASLAADIAAIKDVVDTVNTNTDTVESGLSTANSNITAIDGKIGTPEGASLSADVAAIKDVVDTINGNTDSVEAVLGTPAGASISADVAAVQSKLGTPAGADISADIAAIKSVVDGISTFSGGYIV